MDVILGRCIEISASFPYNLALKNFFRLNKNISLFLHSYSNVVSKASNRVKSSVNSENGGSKIIFGN